MSNDPSLIELIREVNDAARELIREVNDAARELIEGVEKRQKEKDRTLIVMGALLVTVIMVKMWFEVLS